MHIVEYRIWQQPMNYVLIYFFSLLFYFTKYNNMVVKSHIIKKKNRSFIDVIFNMLISLTFNDNLISIYKHC